MKINRTDAHSALAAERATARADYMASGQFSTDWEVFVALDTYLQLQENIAGEMYPVRIVRLCLSPHIRMPVMLLMKSFPPISTSKLCNYIVTVVTACDWHIIWLAQQWWPGHLRIYIAGNKSMMHYVDSGQCPTHNLCVGHCQMPCWLWPCDLCAAGQSKKQCKAHHQSCVRSYPAVAAVAVAPEERCK